MRLIENAHSAPISSMDASSALGLIATGAADGTLRLWDFCAFDLVADLTCHAAAVTTVAFASPAPLPILVSADEIGEIAVWAVRGSRYTERLLMVLRNYGPQSGPRPPSLVTTSLKNLRSTEVIHSRTILKQGIPHVDTVDGKAIANGDDRELSNYFSIRRAANEHSRRAFALKDMLGQEINNAFDKKTGPSSAATSPAGVSARPAASGARPVVPALSLPFSGLAPIHIPSSPPSPTVPRVPLSPIDAVLSSAASAKASGDLIAIPITHVIALCLPLSSDEAEVMKLSEKDSAWADAPGCNVRSSPLSLRIFTADSQGVIKCWDLSQELARFMANGTSELGALKPEREISQLGAYNPRQLRHRVYPFTDDGDASAAVVGYTAPAPAAQWGGPAIDASNTFLARIRMQRQLLSAGRRRPKTAVNFQNNFVSNETLERAAIAAETAAASSTATATAQRPTSAGGARLGARATAPRPTSAGAASARRPSHAAPHGLSYPPVKPLVGAVNYMTFDQRARRVLPLVAFAVGLPPNATSDPLKDVLLGSVPVTAGGALTPNKSRLRARTGGSVGGGSSARDSSSTSRSLARSLVYLSSQEREELWYQFSGPNDAALLPGVEEIAAALGATQADADPSSAPSSASMSSAAAAGDKKTWVVPAAAWAHSRLRLDITPSAQWTAHTDSLTSLTVAHRPLTLVSTSRDGSVRLWLPNGLPIGVVSVPPSNAELKRAQEMADQIARQKGMHVPRTIITLTPETCPWQYEPSSEGVSTSVDFAKAFLKRLDDDVREERLAAEEKVKLLRRMSARAEKLARAATKLAELGMPDASLTTHVARTGGFLIGSSSGVVEETSDAAKNEREGVVRFADSDGGGGGVNPTADGADADDFSGSFGGGTDYASCGGLGDYVEYASTGGSSRAGGAASSGGGIADALGSRGPDEAALREETEEAVAAASDALTMALVHTLETWNDVGVSDLSVAARKNATRLGSALAPTNGSSDAAQRIANALVESSLPPNSPSSGVGNEAAAERARLLHDYPKYAEQEAGKAPKVGAEKMKQSLRESVAAMIQSLDVSDASSPPQAHTSRPTSAASNVRPAVSRPTSAAAGVRPVSAIGGPRPVSAIGGPRPVSAVGGARPVSAIGGPRAAATGTLSRPASAAGLVSKTRGAVASESVASRLDSLMEEIKETRESARDVQKQEEERIRAAEARANTDPDYEVLEEHWKLAGTLSDALTTIAEPSVKVISSPTRRRPDDVFSDAFEQEVRRVSAGTSALSLSQAVSAPAMNPADERRARALAAATLAPHVNNLTFGAAGSGVAHTKEGATAALPVARHKRALLTAASFAEASVAAARAAKLEEPSTSVRPLRALLSTSPTRVPQRTVTDPPAGLDAADRIMWPWRGYEPPKRFGPYTRAQVLEFRKLWMQLDKDGSGSVTVDELLNSNAFDPAQMRHTKTLFASIDKSGDGELDKSELRAFIIAKRRFIFAAYAHAFSQPPSPLPPPPSSSQSASLSPS